ncbi:MAG: hypothetical protein Q9169_005123 [Polycauliona sp. 2 TL-2023]
MALPAAPAATNPQSSLSTPPPESPFHPKSNSSSFDILATYNYLLTTSPTITMPLAAISSLITLLTHSPPSTTSETLSLLSHHSSILKNSVRNPIALSAGTDLFQRYIISTLQSSLTASDTQSTQDFRAVRDQLVTNGQQFVARAQAARGMIARIGVQFVQDGGTVLTSGRSRVVSAVLNAAADEGVRFRVVYVRSDSGFSDPSDPREDDVVPHLRAKGIPIAVIQPSATAYSLGKISMVMVGAEGVVENGGVVSRIGTYQLAMLAKSARKPVYVVAESHKFVRLYPLGQYDLPTQQMIVDFRDRTDDDGDERDGTDGGERRHRDGRKEDEEAVDYTPPELITALVTETGVHTPSAVSEELIKIWY